MTRVVIHLEWRVEADMAASLVERDQRWAELLRLLFDRAIALGGRVVASSDLSVVVDFSWEGLRDAVDFLVDAPLSPDLAAGICHGDPLTIGGGPHWALAVGESLRCAAKLAELARPGEVLVSPELVRDATGRLGTAGEVGRRPGRPEIRAFVLDSVTPLLDSCRNPLSEGLDSEALPEAFSYRSPSSRAPESERARHVNALASVTEALGIDEHSVFPPEVTSALRKRDSASLQELAEAVRTEHKAESAERIEAIAELADGRSGEALRRLRHMKFNAQAEDPSARCRAGLALAVALSAAGRAYEAALEALDAIARAREGSDTRGEQACAHFLSRLALMASDTESSEAWAAVRA